MLEKFLALMASKEGLEATPRQLIIMQNMLADRREQMWRKAKAEKEAAKKGKPDA